MSIEQTRIYPINTGWIKVDHGTYLFWKGNAGNDTAIPVICYLVDTRDHKIMVDTGLPDEARATKWHHDCNKRGCLDSPDAVRHLGFDPAAIDICLFTHLHWDHTHNMKDFTNARYICTAEELRWAHNPLPLYYRSYESPKLGIEAPFTGCDFEVVEGEAEIVPGVSVFPTPGHTPGHQCVSVETSAGKFVIAGDAIFLYENLEPNFDEQWRHWVPARFVNVIDGWQSIEEIDKRADYVLPTHDERVLEHDVFPFGGMPLRDKHRQVSGTSFYFGGD